MEPFLKIPSNIYNALRCIAPEKDTRYYLCGVCFDFGKERLAATDGHRMLLAPFGEMPGDITGLEGQKIVACTCPGVHPQ